MGPIRSFIDWIGRAQVVQSILTFIKPFVWPWLVAMVTGAAGYWGHQPLMWIVMAAALTFMGTVVGVFFADAFRDRKSPLNKILYTGTAVNYDLKAMPRQSRRAAATGILQARILDKMQVGVFMHNSAPFPISAILEDAETEMEGLQPPRSLFPRAATVIVPGNTVLIMDDPIDMDGHICEKMEGRMNMKIKYGYPGKEKFTMQFKGRVEALMRPEGFLQGTYTHWDSDQSLPTK
jgi:hypothetical protein